MAYPGNLTGVLALLDKGAKVTLPEIDCADTLVANLPSVTAWLGTPLPASVRKLFAQVQL
jgi:hypothetical protein